MKNIYDVVSLRFANAEDSKLIQDRKSAFINLTDKGYCQPVLVYPKANVKEVRINSTAIPHGFVVTEVVRKPHTLDGYVLCVFQ